MKEFDFDNCSIDAILEFAHKNYTANKEEIDAKTELLKQENKKPETHEGTCELNC